MPHLLLLLSLAFATPASGVVWEHDYLEAFEQAAELHRPVLICINMDNEWANDTLAREVYIDPAFVELSRSFVCLAASSFKHGAQDDQKACTRFPGITCGEHKLIENQTRHRFIKGQTVIAPQHIVADADQKLLSRQAYYNGMDALFDFLKGALGQDAGALVPGGEYDPDEPIRLPKRKLSELRERATTTDWMELYELMDEVGRLARPIAVALFSEFAENRRLPEKVRVGAIERLGLRGSYDTIDLLISLLKDKDIDLKVAAARSLEVAELPPATEALLELLRHRPSQVLKCAVLRSLGACGADNPKTLKALERGLRDSNAYVRCSAALGLGYVVAALARSDSGEPDPARSRAIRKLVAALRDRQSQVRGAAAYAIGLARATEARAALEKLSRQDDSDDVCDCAVAALANLDREGQVPTELLRYRWKFTGNFSR